MHALPRSRLGFGFFASMSSSAARVGGGGGRDPSNNPAVGRLRELVQRGDAADGWEKSWEAAVTPWDLGKPTPIIEHLVKSGTLPKGRALVPGCGTASESTTPFAICLCLLSFPRMIIDAFLVLVPAQCTRTIILSVQRISKDYCRN
ncbi:hypothetical protein DAI22_06g038550 [Oryza sativa Japonica Group]|nr:hypothetical protein DAI22_06g038550 [Oryza sativa Japonica Group]